MIHLDELVVTKRLLFSVGLKIQDGYQSWALIAGKIVCVASIISKEILRPWMWQNQQFFTIGLGFMTNDNVDMLTICKLLVVENG